MAVKIRLKKLGRRKRPFYRIVAIDSRFRRDGIEIERLGWYDPIQNIHSCKLNEERVLHWLGQGAIPSETVKGLFRREGLSYKWYLMKQGLKGLELDKLIEEWSEREKNRIEVKRDKKIKKKELFANKAKASEEAPAEETVEETPVEAAAEEAPVEEEVSAEEAPAEETVEETPVETAEEAPAEETIEETPVEAAAEEAPAEETIEETPVEAAAEETSSEETVEETPNEEESKEKD